MAAAVSRRFVFLDAPSREVLGDSPEDFIAGHGAPICLRVPGADTTRCRALVTLLHGNEPSGLRAVWHWLQTGEQPAVTLLIIIASVAAALEEPRFTHRMLPRARDLNRCFRAPFDDEQGRLAEEILTLLDLHRPEAVVDMHNTSGSGPDFAVAAVDDAAHAAIAALFTHRLVLTPLNLGALMEMTCAERPVVTIEVGGREDPGSDTLALEGLQRYAGAREIRPHGAGLPPITRIHDPLRVELLAGVTLAYAAQPQPGRDLTLDPAIEHYNFGLVSPDTCLGWARGEVSALLRARDGDGRCALDQLLRVQDGLLYPARSLILFMITTHSGIAETDCLFYAAAADGSTLRGRPDL